MKKSVEEIQEKLQELKPILKKKKSVSNMNSAKDVLKAYLTEVIEEDVPIFKKKENLHAAHLFLEEKWANKIPYENKKVFYDLIKKFEKKTKRKTYSAEENIILLDWLANSHWHTQGLNGTWNHRFHNQYVGFESESVLNDFESFLDKKEKEEYEKSNVTVKT